MITSDTPTHLCGKLSLAPTGNEPRVASSTLYKVASQFISRGKGIKRILASEGCRYTIEHEGWLWSTWGGLYSTNKHWLGHYLELQEDIMLSKRSKRGLRRGQVKGYNQDGWASCATNKAQNQATTSIWAKKGHDPLGQNGYRNERITHSFDSAKKKNRKTRSRRWTWCWTSVNRSVLNLSKFCLSLSKFWCFLNSSKFV